MTTVENQKTIKTEKAKADKDNLYGIFNLDALTLAANILKNDAFKLWCYINKNQNGYTFALSKVDALKWGIGSKSSYDRAVKELREKNYLVETSPNHFTFYEIPKVEEEIVITVEKAE